MPPLQVLEGISRWEKVPGFSGQGSVCLKSCEDTVRWPSLGFVLPVSQFWVTAGWTLRLAVGELMALVCTGIPQEELQGPMRTVKDGEGIGSRQGTKRYSLSWAMVPLTSFATPSLALASLPGLHLLHLGPHLACGQPEGRNLAFPHDRSGTALGLAWKVGGG
jgi:hypothetical protein